MPEVEIRVYSGCERLRFGWLESAREVANGTEERTAPPWALPRADGGRFDASIASNVSRPMNDALSKPFMVLLWYQK